MTPLTPLVTLTLLSADKVLCPKILHCLPSLPLYLLLRRLARAEYKYNRERDAIRVEHERKKEDKKARREEIKKKYGAVGTMDWVPCVWSVE